MTASELDPSALVAAFSEASARVETLYRLQALGDAALPAVREGLQDPDWHVRHWCAIYLDRGGTADVLPDLIPLLHDPEPQVRLWAIHSLACEHCKEGECQLDVVPLLLDRLERDPHVRVRKMAAAMLFTLPVDARVPAALEASLARETDRKLRLHVQRALERYQRPAAG